MIDDSEKRERPVYRPGGGGGGVLPIMAHMGRLRPKGVPFSDLRSVKG